MDKYAELEKTRLELYNEYKKENSKGTKFIIIALIGVILAIVFNNLESLSFMSFISGLAVFISIVALIIIYSKANSVKQKFIRVIKDTLVEEVLKEHLKDYKYDEKDHISINKINSVQLVQAPDRFKGEDLITGSYKDVKFQVSDITLTERRVRSNGKHTTVDYIDYFKGRWYIYKFEKNFNNTLKIVERSLGNKTRGLKKFETEMIDFNKKFSIYASDEQFFYYVMNPFLIEKLLLLENAHKGTIHYCIKDNELHIGINDNSDSLSLDFSKVINEQSIYRFVEDVILIKTIIDELRLYDIKFRE